MTENPRIARSELSIFLPNRVIPTPGDRTRGKRW